MSNVLFCIYQLCIIYQTHLYRIFMPKSHSFRSEPWNSFSKQSDSIFHEDFIKDKLFTFKTSHQPSRGIIKFKEMISANTERYRFDEQVKVWFPFRNQGSSIFTQIKVNEAKIRYDHGVRSYNNNLINFYGGIQSEKNFRNIVFKIGANLLLVNTNFDSRLRVAYRDSGKIEVSSGHKFNWTSQKWTVDVCNIFNFHVASLFNNAFRVIYRVNEDNQIYVKGQNNKIRQFSGIDFMNLDTYFTNFTIDYIRKVDKSTRIALQTSFTKKSLLNTSFVVLRMFDQLNSKLKMKLSLDKSVSLSYQSRINNYGRWMVGWEVSSLGNKNHSKLGLMLDLNL